MARGRLPKGGDLAKYSSMPPGFCVSVSQSRPDYPKYCPNPWRKKESEVSSEVVSLRVVVRCRSVLLKVCPQGPADNNFWNVSAPWTEKAWNTRCRRIWVMKAAVVSEPSRNPVGTQSEPSRNPVGDQSEPSRSPVGSEGRCCRSCQWRARPPLRDKNLYAATNKCLQALIKIMYTVL